MTSPNLVVVAIDDRPDNLITLKAVLTDIFPGIDVKTATNGQQGIELARAEDPDVILLDLVMPDMDGFKVCRKLKADAHLRDIPVIFLTALRSDRSTRLRAIEVGGEGFLTKPIEETELITQIRAMAKIKAASVSRQKENERLAALVVERTRELEAELSERRRTERILADERRLLRTVIDNLPDAVYAMDARLRKVLANRADLANIGAKSEADVLGKTDLELFPSNTGEHLMAEGREVLQTGQPLVNHEQLLINHRGHSRWLSTSKFPLRDESGQITGLVGIGHDITERKQAESERQQLLTQIEMQARQVQQIVETVPQGVLLIGEDGQVLLTNPVADRDLAALAQGSRSRIQKLGNRPLRELLTSLPGELWHEVRAGSRVFEIIAQPIADSGDPRRWVLVIDDVTLKRQARDELQQQERLAAVGRLAAGIAHDFNNIVAVIVLYAQMISRQKDLPNKARARADVIYEQAHRATDLIQQILDFSRRAPMERKPMALLPLLKETSKLWERTLPENIRIELVHDGNACRIDGDPSRLQQALMNLATNARDAMPEGGKLRMELGQVTYGVNNGAPMHTLVPGEWVKLTLTDTGTGMTPDVLSHVFEPFFTTKAAGKGTGLGLAQVHGIIKQHDGEISVDSAPGRGTTFAIYLPALPENTGQTTESLETSTLPVGSGELILIAEDNPATRAAIIGALELLGYRTLPASDGREALDLYATRAADNSTPVELVISDLTMPNMGGKELAAELQSLGADIPLVILSGYIGDEIAQDLAPLGITQCLRKPLDLPELARVMSEALSRHHR